MQVVRDTRRALVRYRLEDAVSLFGALLVFLAPTLVSVRREHIRHRLERDRQSLHRPVKR